jgi:hypothetical protein
MMRILRSPIVWALLAGMLPGHAAAQERRRDESPLVREAQALLLAAYPELRDGRVSWRVQMTSTGVVLDARRITAPEQILAASSVPLVGARVVADERGALQALRAHGTLVDEARQRLTAATSPTRSTEDILTAAGARYGPSNESALATLVPAGVPRVLRATVRARTFRETVADAAEEALTWQVELDTDTHTYSVLFEPVEGRLLSVVRR